MNKTDPRQVLLRRLPTTFKSVPTARQAVRASKFSIKDVGLRRQKFCRRQVAALSRKGMYFALRPIRMITMNISHNNRVKKLLTVLVSFAYGFLFQGSCFAQSDIPPVRSQSGNESTDCSSSTQPENAQPLPGWQGSDLHKAISRQDIVTVRKLLKQKANPNEKDNYGNVPLFYTVGPRIGEPKIKPSEVKRHERGKGMQFQLEAEEELLKYGADPNLRGIDDVPILVEAASGGFGHRHTIQVLNLLIEYKADVNLRDKHGFTALMAAAQTGSPDVVNFLLEHGADVAMTDCKGTTAMSIAQSLKHTDVVRILQGNN